MEISFALWVQVQAVLANVFMVRALFLLWVGLNKTEGVTSTASMLAGLFALHGIASILMFSAMGMTGAYLIPNANIVRVMLLMVAVSTIPLIAVKTALTWLGERRGRTCWWRLYLFHSTLWAAAAIIF